MVKIYLRSNDAKFPQTIDAGGVEPFSQQSFNELFLKAKNDKCPVYFLGLTTINPKGTEQQHFQPYDGVKLKEYLFRKSDALDPMTGKKIQEVNYFVLRNFNSKGKDQSYRFHELNNIEKKIFTEMVIALAQECVYIDDITRFKSGCLVIYSYLENFESGDKQSQNKQLIEASKWIEYVRSLGGGDDGCSIEVEVIKKFEEINNKYLKYNKFIENKKIESNRKRQRRKECQSKILKILSGGDSKTCKEIFKESMMTMTMVSSELQRLVHQKQIMKRKTPKGKVSTSFFLKLNKNAGRFC